MATHNSSLKQIILVNFIAFVNLMQTNKQDLNSKTATI